MIHGGVDESDLKDGGNLPLHKIKTVEKISLKTLIFMSRDIIYIGIISFLLGCLLSCLK